jgi:hypothetical protein
LTFCDGEYVEDFSMRLMSLMNQLAATLGDPEVDDKIVVMYLHVTRPRYHQLIVSIEALLDISTLGMIIQLRIPGTRPDKVGYGDDFLTVGDTRTRPEPRWVRVGIFSTRG